MSEAVAKAERAERVRPLRPPAPVATPARPHVPPPPPGYENLDRLLHAARRRACTHGISPAALTGATMDWLVHLANAPGKRLTLARQALAGRRAARDLRPAPGARARGRAAGRTGGKRPPLRRSRLAGAALRLAGAGLPPRRGLVEGGHDRPAGRHGPARAAGRLRRPPAARRALARSNFPWSNPEVVAPHRRGGRPQPPARLGPLARGRGGPAHGPGTRRGPPRRRPGRGGDAR